MLTGDMLRRSAERFPNKPAVIWEGQVLSYRELDQAANRLANALLSAGIRKGEKVGIVCRNRIEYPIVFFGVARTGAVLVNISTLYQSGDLAYVLQKADVTTLLYEDLFNDKVDAVRGGLPLLRQCIRIGRGGDDVLFDDFISGADASYPAVELSIDDPFCMTYTGGTTGRPKACCAAIATATSRRTPWRSKKRWTSVM